MLRLIVHMCFHKINFYNCHRLRKYLTTKISRSMEDNIVLKQSRLILTLAAPADFDGSSSCALYLASLAFSRPRWYSVAECGSMQGGQGDGH